MSKVILITGDLASGKSSLANSLSYRLNIPAFEKDVIKEHYVDKYGFKNREENRALSIKAVDFMITSMESFLKKQADVILEANFRGNELTKIKEICGRYNSEVTLLVLRGDIPFLYERFLERLPNRHKAHTSIGLEESIDKFASYINEQRQEDLVFPHFDIDITHLSYDDVLEMALRKIG